MVINYSNPADGAQREKYKNKQSTSTHNHMKHYNIANTNSKLKKSRDKRGFHGRATNYLHVVICRFKCARV